MLKGPCVSREFQITLYSPFGDDLLTLPKTKRRVEAHWQIDFFFFSDSGWAGFLRKPHRKSLQEAGSRISPETPLFHLSFSFSVSTPKNKPQEM
jgi:hypothetical protein